MLFDLSVGNFEVVGRRCVEAGREHGEGVRHPVKQFVDQLGLSVDTARQLFQHLTAASALLRCLLAHRRHQTLEQVLSA